MLTRLFSRSHIYTSLGLGCALLFACLVIRFWHPAYGFTSFLQMDTSSDPGKIAAFKDEPIYIYKDTGGYDGQYYAQIAYHPLLNAKELVPAMDSLSYRARRILPSALAYIFALGKPYWIVQVYCLLNCAAWFFLATILWRILSVNNLRSLITWIGVMFSAGALESVRLALTDLIALCILAAGILALERNKKTKAAYLFAVAGLCRETALLSVSVFCNIKPGEKWVTKNRIKLILISVLPLSLWLLYIRYQTGIIDSGIGNLTWPLSAYVVKWNATIDAFYWNADFSLTLTTLLALIGLSTQALYILRNFEISSLWWRLGFAYSSLMLFLGQAVWEGFPGAAQRILLPLTLAFNVIARRRRTGFVVILIGNLTVFSGLLNLKDVPSDSHELSASRLNSVASVIHIEDGFYSCERTYKHTWSWCSGHGKLSVETWPKNSGTINLEFKIRSLIPCHVIAKIDGKICYSGEVTPTKSSGSLKLPYRSGSAVLEFSTESPGVSESSDSHARQLAFALYDVTVVSVTQ